MDALNQLPEKTVTRIDVLDGWRALSVALVIVAHLTKTSTLSSYFAATTPEWDWAYLGRLLGSFGETGVCIFFALSGYVICRGLNTESEKLGRVSVKAFYVRRMFRILPPLWVYLFTIVFLGQVGVLQEVGGIVKAFLFLRNSPNGGSLITAHTWSLSYEEQFYLFFPALFVFMHKKYRTWAFTFLAMGFVTLGLTLNFLKLGEWAGFGYYFAYLIAGAAFSGIEKHISGRQAEILSIFHLPMIIGVFTIWLIPPSQTGTILRAIIGTPLLVVAICGSPLWSSPATRILENSKIASIGRISYGIYLWQQLFTAPYPGAGWLFYGCGILLTLLISYGSYRILEQPLMRIGSRISNNLRQAGLANRTA